MAAKEDLEMLSDEELALKAGAGSRSSFEILVERYSHRLVYFLRPRVGCEQDAEDLAQDTFVKAYRNIARFDNRAAFSTWLYTIAVRLLVSFFRSNRSGGPLPEQKVSAPDPQEKMVREDDARNLWKMARQLPVEQFQALWLYYGEEMNTPEIAAVMKKSRVHIRVLLHRARCRLADRLAPGGLSRETGTPDRDSPGSEEEVMSCAAQ